MILNVHIVYVGNLTFTFKILSISIKPVLNYNFLCVICRTARADSDGTALSFVSVNEMERLEAVEQALADTHRKSIKLKV